MNRSQRLFLLGVCFLLLLAASAGTAAWKIARELETPYPSRPGTRLVRIAPGESVAAIGRKLQQRGVIRSSTLFRWYIQLAGGTRKMQAGEYRFGQPVTLVQVASRLRQGRVYYHKVTIPEGWTADRIAQHLAAAGFGNPESFLGQIGSGQRIADLDPEAKDLEGYLFPETYLLAAQTAPGRIIDQMVASFRRIWTQQRQMEALEAGLTMRQIVTLASMIEKETRRPQERALVSAVFHNRLRLGMKLESDPTVIYAVKKVKPYDGVIHQSDLHLDSPYNTYLYGGLPPGPISNPGEASIDAALRPAAAPYLYFVARNDGTHVFSLRYRDHQRAVATYQRH